MKYHLLSFMVACGLVVAIFVLAHAMQREGAGSAQASINMLGDHTHNYSPSEVLGLKHKISRSADTLMQLNGAAVQQVFNAPELVRSDLPTVVWQYRTDACVLDVYFTASNETNLDKAPVAHYEARSRDAKGRAKVSAQDCVSSMVQGGNLISLLDVGAFLKSGS